MGTVPLIAFDCFDWLNVQYSDVIAKIGFFSGLESDYFERFSFYLKSWPSVEEPAF